MKGQAAMEYLRTYGWVIVVLVAVVAIIVALYTMGMFRAGVSSVTTSTTQPKCQVVPCSPCFPSGSAVAYIDHNADTLVLRVGPRDLAWINVTARGKELQQIGPFQIGDNVTFTSPGTFKGDVDITVKFAYTDIPTTVRSVTAVLHECY